MHKSPLLSLILCATLAAAVPTAPPQDPDPSVGGKRLSDWIAMLTGQDRFGRLQAAQALAFGKIDATASAAVPALAAALADDDGQTRLYAAMALGSLGSAAEPAVPALTTALADPKEYAGFPGVSMQIGSETVFHGTTLIRLFCAAALGKVGPPAVEAIPHLVTLLKDKTLSGSASASLAGIGPSTVPALTAALTDPDKRLRRGAADTLGKLGPMAHDAIDALRQAETDRDKGVRASASSALSKILQK